MLSIKCPNCGSTIKFEENHIATFCSFCGSHLPDMTEYVKKASQLELEKNQHRMEIETIDKDIERQRVIGKVNNTYMIIKLVIGVPLMIAFFVLLFKLASM